MKNCPFCKTENTDEAKFCQKCGHSFEITCPKCGTVNNGTAAFCVQCGTVLPQQKSNKNKVILIVICIVLAIAVVGLIIALTCKNNMEQPAPVIDEANDSLVVESNSEPSAPTSETSETKETIPQSSSTNTVTDIDGNTYATVQIGEQCWMKENLRTTHYADGTSILHGSTTSDDVGYWYYPANNSSNKATYGLLYNWKAVMRNSSSSSSNPSGVQGICPKGWHVPSDAEWKQLEMAMGMSQSDAADDDLRGNIAAKLCGNTGWKPSSYANAAGNTSAPNRNSSGFSALPAGYYYGGLCQYFGYEAEFWSATEFSSTLAYDRYLSLNLAGVARNYNTNDKTNGYSVRCVRD